MIIVLALIALGAIVLTALSYVIFPRWTSMIRVVFGLATFGIFSIAFMSWVFWLAYSDIGTPVSQDEIQAAAEPTKGQ